MRLAPWLDEMERMAKAQRAPGESVWLASSGDVGLLINDPETGRTTSARWMPRLGVMSHHDPGDEDRRTA